MKIINKTPHEIVIFSPNGEDILKIIPPSGNAIRVSEELEKSGSLGGIPLVKKKFKRGNIPAQKKEIYYIISSVVKSHFPERTDFLYPCDPVRDEDGTVIGCKSLGI